MMIVRVIIVSVSASIKQTGTDHILIHTGVPPG